jgi:hypothetical protein
VRRLVIITMAALAVATLGACANTTSIVKTHPEKVVGLPNCRECHSDSWQAFNHKATDFYLKHRYYGQQQRLACASCHEESFCSDCHAHKEELTPSRKFAEAPERNLPHRGDYLSQHKIDGLINPASCAKCHGRQNNERCITCHR